ncbi:MAG: alpha/beta hydrolase [Chitinophagaceae bacterium]
MFLLLFFGTWVVLAQSCMRMRISDSVAKKEFGEKNLLATFSYLPGAGINMHYVKTGVDTLPTLLFIHGSPGSWDAFKTYLEDSNLLANFRMISVDRPGFGYSDFGYAKDLRENAKFIFAIVQKEANGKPLHLIGHSIGGPVVMQMAQDHPENYASLTILAGSISPYDEPKEAWRGIVKYSPFRYLMPGAFGPSNDEIWSFKKDLYGLDTNYNRVTMPVMFIHGDADKFVTVKNVAYGFTKLVANKQVGKIIIPGASHFIPWQHFDVIKKHLMGLKTAF